MAVLDDSEGRPDVEQTDARLLQFSVVVVGQFHNPSILNPDFLRVRNIIPDEWGWEVAEGGLTTPAFALVPYKQAAVIIVEHEKLQIVDRATSIEQSKATEIADRYVRTLPHVRYTAVGINFQAAIDVEHPQEFLKTRFLKPGLWDSARHSLQALGLRLVYPLEEGRLGVSLDVGEITGDASDQTGAAKRSAIIANANFHWDCTTYPADDEVSRYLLKAGECWQIFRCFLTEVLNVEWIA